MANNDMHVSHLCLQIVKDKEGTGPNRVTKNGVLYVLPYHGKRDEPDIWTVGYGHAFHKRDLVKWSSGLTLQEADALLRRDMLDFETKVKNRIKVPLNQHQFDALCSLVYNCGPAPLYGSTGDAINDKNFYLAVKHIATDYVKTDPDGAGPKPKEVTDGLVRRRLTEAWLFHTGEVFIANTPQRRDLLLRRLIEKRLIPADGPHMPNWAKYPKTGYPA